VHELRTLVRKFGSGAKIIAKIERYAAVENIREILSVSDAILVARGDLGVEIPWTELPAVQDYLVAAAIKAVKPVVVATEFLSSMVNNAFPTRAEITDIMHAIDSGVTGILLSDETAVGRFGVEAVQILRTAAENQRRPWLVHS
jgi:pyruvate kinase